MVDGEEQLFSPTHPIWKIIGVLAVGLLALNGVTSPDLVAGVI